jgi:hypothetical protein
VSTRHRTKYIPYKMLCVLYWGDLHRGASRIVEDGGTTIEVDKSWLRDHLGIQAGRLDEYLDWTQAAIGATILISDAKRVTINLPHPGDWRPPTASPRGSPFVEK